MQKTDLFRIFADAIRPWGWEALWEELSRRVEHYILKGVTLRFVFGCSKLPHIECNPRQCKGDCHGA